MEGRLLSLPAAFPSLQLQVALKCADLGHTARQRDVHMRVRQTLGRPPL